MFSHPLPITAKRKSPIVSIGDFCIHMLRPPRPKGRGGYRRSKNLVEFRQWHGERESDHFLRRHVRRRKYFSACKRARRPPPADSACATVRQPTPFVKKYYFLTDTRPPRPFGRGGYRDFRSRGAYARFHLTPCGVSSSTMPSALSSSRMRSALAQFLALRAA